MIDSNRSYDFHVFEIKPTTIEELEQCIADAKVMAGFIGNNSHITMYSTSSTYKREIVKEKYRYVGTWMTSYNIVLNKYCYNADYFVERLLEWLNGSKLLSDDELKEILSYYSQEELKDTIKPYNNDENKEKLRHLFGLLWELTWV